MKNRLESIQHLRGIAALLVVFVHFPTPLARFCGSIGVDIFFFISGFIIYTSIDRSKYYDRPVDFLKKRLLRILPLYWVATILFILMHVVLNKIRYSPYSPSLDVTTIVKSFFFIPIEKNGIYHDPLIALGWSLSFEMLFYILSFLFILIFKNRYFLPLLMLLVGLGLAGYVFPNTGNVYFEFLSSSFLLYFATGFLLGRFQQKVLEKMYPITEWVFFIAIFFLFLLMLGKDYGYPYVGMPREKVVFDGVAYPRFFLWGFPSLLFFVSYFSLATKYNIRNTFLNHIGDSSYSIYLLQIFFTSFLFEVAFALNEMTRTAVSFVLMGLLVVVAGLSYKYFEKRFHK